MIIDYKKLTWLLLPTFLRRQLMMAVSGVLVLPLQHLHDKHSEQIDKRMYLLSHTSQTCHLKAALNDEFGIIDYSAGFQIEDIDAQGRYLTAWDEIQEAESRHITLKDTEPIVLYDHAEMKPTSSFRIIVPTQIEVNEYNEARIRAIADTYRLASRTYTIKRL